MGYGQIQFWIGNPSHPIERETKSLEERKEKRKKICPTTHTRNRSFHGKLRSYTPHL
jgi:hypothetical protein